MLVGQHLDHNALTQTCRGARQSEPVQSFFEAPGGIVPKTTLGARRQMLLQGRAVRERLTVQAALQQFLAL
jgi:hypothetical protein